ncbi:LLM class flavin-dependent oxidoreductase [Nostoc commune]|uniref:LLM class flavin-dependent oxidoreductase n=1 Tax=Nostoc commune TaxID=1178 RepID=UPI001E402246|nr:LLM class flavin-dependent oxidoreductase [Nostoc commune]
MLEPRYGIWVPVGGNFGPLDTPDEPIDASYERTRSLVLEAERLGYVTTLVAQHLANPRSLDLKQLETWTACAALAEATESIEIIAAIKPLLFHPAVLAKMALGIDGMALRKEKIVEAAGVQRSGGAGEKEEVLGIRTDI